MARIYETKNFTVETADEPHITRTDGGHIVILPKKRVADRTQLTPAQAIELIRLTMVVGEAMAEALNNRGIDIGKINYQDNGNWGVFDQKGPHMHIHLYGRAKSAKIQKYGESLNFPRRETGFYNNYEPLDNEDISAIQEQINLILKKPKYQDTAWRI